MSDTSKPRHADAKVDEAVKESFPASDPTVSQGGRGARAVPAEHMMPGEAPPTPADSVTLDLRFPDSEAAKLALEAAVREGPMDRRCATIDLDDDRVTMRVDVPPADAERVEAVLRKHGATDG